MTILFLNEDELRQTVTITEAIEKVESAFLALTEGRLNIPGGFNLNLPEVQGEVEVKGSYINDAPYYVIKVGSSFYQNPSINLPTHSGFMAIFDAATGFPVAIMFDNGYITRMRAGAAGALTAQYLANEALDQVAVIGTGYQAYNQIKALMMVRNFKKVLVWGRTPVKVDSYARRLVEDHDLNIDIAASVKEAVQNADLVITATASQEPLVRAEWLKPGVHIIAVGSNRANKQELHVDVLQQADLIIADKLSQCMEIGEIHHGLVAEVITAKDVHGELGDLIAGKIEGRTHSDQITVADLTGLDVQDAAIAILALEKALFIGLGQRGESGAATDIPSWSVSE